MSTIIIRKLDGDWDPQRGSSLANFIADREAVAQIIVQRLKLLQGEWFEDQSDGTPVFQSLLGHAITIQSLTMILRDRITSSPFVTGISALSVAYASAGRSFAFVATVQTAFGIVTVTNQ